MEKKHRVCYFQYRKGDLKGQFLTQKLGVTRSGSIRCQSRVLDANEDPEEWSYEGDEDPDEKPVENQAEVEDVTVDAAENVAEK